MGEGGYIYSYQFALKLHRDIANSRVVILPDVGHMPQEESPSILLYIMNSFLSSRNRSLNVDPLPTDEVTSIL